jgi:hypothetical protein
MTPERDKELCEKYPLIFADRGKSMMESCMYWGLAVGDGWYNIIDIACGTIQNHIDWSIKSHDITIKHNAMVTATRAGDLTLFNKLNEKLDNRYRKETLDRILFIGEEEGKPYGSGLRLVEPIVPQLVADQVKEKFAGLRFYHHGGDEFCDGVLQMAEGMSIRTCEECGAPGTIGGKGWIKTLCETHRKKIDEEQYSHHKETDE